MTRTLEVHIENLTLHDGVDRARVSDALATELTRLIDGWTVTTTQVADAIQAELPKHNRNGRTNK